ncbi:MAG TPA: hypothetical protein VEW92_03475 [Nitrososphaeraceae archaeon]|jgi:hypothetical protein|nr:hypothetical protein [Nitrososphaeraceae archaeon]
MKSAKIIEINQLSSNTRKQNSKTQRFSSVGKSSIIWSLSKIFTYGRLLMKDEATKELRTLKDGKILRRGGINT